MAEDTEGKIRDGILSRRAGKNGLRKVDKQRKEDPTKKIDKENEAETTSKTIPNGLSRAVEIARKPKKTRKKKPVEPKPVVDAPRPTRKRKGKKSKTHAKYSRKEAREKAIELVNKILSRVDFEDYEDPPLRDMVYIMATQEVTEFRLGYNLSERGKLLAIVGEVGNGKSTMTMIEDICASSGKFWIKDYDEDPGPEEICLWIDAENGHDETYKRSHKIGLAYGCDETSGFSFRCNTYLNFFTNRWSSLITLVTWILELGATRVTLDAITAFMEGGNITQQKDVDYVLKPLLSLTRELDVTIKFLHNYPKKMKVYAGSAQIYANVDVMVEIAANFATQLSTFTWQKFRMEHGLVARQPFVVMFHHLGEENELEGEIYVEFFGEPPKKPGKGEFKNVTACRFTLFSLDHEPASKTKVKKNYVTKHGGKGSAFGNAFTELKAMKFISNVEGTVADYELTTLGQEWVDDNK